MNELAANELNRQVRLPSCHCLQTVAGHPESVGRRHNWDWRRFLSLENYRQESERGSKLNVATKAEGKKETDKQVTQVGPLERASEPGRELTRELIGFQLSTPIVLARRDHRRQKRRARSTAEENPIILAIPSSSLFPGEIGLLTLSDRRGEKGVCHPARSLRHALSASQLRKTTRCGE